MITLLEQDGWSKLSEEIRGMHNHEFIHYLEGHRPIIEWVPRAKVFCSQDDQVARLGLLVSWKLLMKIFPMIIQIWDTCTTWNKKIEEKQWMIESGGVKKEFISMVEFFRTIILKNSGRGLAFSGEKV